MAKPTYTVTQMLGPWRDCTAAKLWELPAGSAVHCQLDMDGSVTADCFVGSWLDSLAAQTADALCSPRVLAVQIFTPEVA